LRDPLTGLANRRLLDELIDIGLTHAKRDDLTLAVAYIDLDGFKKVNDATHDAGDVVLCETARRLLSIVRSTDLVARLGGDEFVIVYEPNLTVRRACSYESTRCWPSRSPSAHRRGLLPGQRGYADTRTAGRDPAALLAAADAAMYDVKRTRTG